MLLCTHFVFLAGNDELCPCSIGSRAQFAFLCFWERSIFAWARRPSVVAATTADAELTVNKRTGS